MAGLVVERLQKEWSKVGLRARLEGFLALALLPLAGLLLLLGLQERNHEIERARQNVLVLAERGAAQHAETLRQAHSVLRMLTLVPEVRMALPEECALVLRQTAALNPWATWFSVAHPDGRLLCDSDDRQLNLADRQYFQKAIASQRFTVSNYVVGRRSARPLLIAALPTVTEVGTIDRVLLVGIDLRWFAGLAADAARSTDAMITLLDAGGTVLAREPNGEAMVGRPMGSHPTIKPILEAATGVVEGVGLDGVARIIGFASLGNSGVRLTVGITRDTVVASINRTLLYSTGVVAMAVIITMIGIWILMEVLVLRGLRDLRLSAARMSSGRFDLDNASAIASLPPGEIGKVAHAVQVMGRKLGGIAYQDRLTGLPNRRAFDAYVERFSSGPALRAKAAAVLYIDLDGFKPVNDRHGHHIGDAVLVEVGARIEHCVRTGDLAVRLGGDEFAVVVSCADGSAAHTAQDVASRIIAGIAEPFRIEDKDIRIGCSIGVALWPAHGQSLSQVLRNADHALYDAKYAGRGRVVTYEHPGP